MLFQGRDRELVVVYQIIKDIRNFSCPSPEGNTTGWRYRELGIDFYF